MEDDEAMISAPEDVANREDASLSDLIPVKEWSEYRLAIAPAARRGLGFALGGGLALSTYSGRWRNTKDVDLFIRPDDRWDWIDLATSVGFADYHDQAPYDRTWIYRGVRNDLILDLIWTMPNHRTQVDDAWLARGPLVLIHGMRLRLIPPEEYVWSKLYVLQRDRCDWPDILNVLRGYGCQMDWRRLLRRVGHDRPVLAAVVSVYRWLSPATASDLPGWLWGELGLRPPEAEPAAGQAADSEQRAFQLDTREWFGPTLGSGGLCS